MEEDHVHEGNDNDNINNDNVNNNNMQMDDAEIENVLPLELREHPAIKAFTRSERNDVGNTNNTTNTNATNTTSTHPTSFIITNPRLPGNPIIYASSGFLQLTGYPIERVLGRNCRFLQGPETDPVSVARMREAIDHGHDVAVCLLNYRLDGSIFWNKVMISGVRTNPTSPFEVTYFIGLQCLLQRPPSVMATATTMEISDATAITADAAAGGTTTTSSNNGTSTTSTTHGSSIFNNGMFPLELLPQPSSSSASASASTNTTTRRSSSIMDQVAAAAAAIAAGTGTSSSSSLSSSISSSRNSPSNDNSNNNNNTSNNNNDDNYVNHN